MQLLPLTTVQLWWRTLKADRRRYHAPPAAPFRPASGRRLWRLLAPDLSRPLFLIGAPRSGTTFLGDCLAALPELTYHHEPIATKAAARHVYEGDWSSRRARLIYRWTYASLMRQHGVGHLRFTEKTPRNCFILPFLSQTFPEAQFVHIIRDGRDAALSYSKMPWLQAAASQESAYEPGGYRFGAYPRFWVEAERREEFAATSDLHRCIWAWRRHVSAAIAVGRPLPSPRYLELRFDRLVARPAATATLLLDFLAITAPASRRKFQSAMSLADPSLSGKWRAELSAAQRAPIEREADALLRQLDYLAP